MKKSVCIIGAGVSGITSTKHCIEAGLEPTCFESSQHLGGLWNDKNKLAVPSCTVTNTSKELTCFSDFPMPDDFPNFMHSDKLFEYIKSYAEKFRVLNYIKFGCQVVNLECCASQHGNCVCATCVKNLGKYWKVTVKRADTEEDYYFDYLIVANGFNSDPYIPNEVKESVNGFGGQLIHSSQYRTWKPFENKRIVICGLGNSGGDISCELSRHASQVYLATKHGSYVLNRLKPAGYPYDTWLLRRSSNILPSFLTNIYIPLLCNSSFNHSNFGLEPDSSSPFVVPMINDELSARIPTGTLKIKPNIINTNERTVVFKDGSRAEDIDAIIFCTGYKRNFHFLKDENILGIPPTEKFFGLYKFIFPTKHLGRVAFVGATGVSGSVIPVFEMQSRYAIEVFRGAVKLPDESKMIAAVQQHYEYCSRLKNVTREMLRVRYTPYQDELALEIGAKPSIWKLFFTDPRLAFHTFFGPACPYQYRLMGPGTWDGARNAILTVDERIWYPLKQRSKQASSRGRFLKFFFYFILTVFSMFIIFKAF